MPSALLCEDDRAIRSLLERLLQREGYAVVLATDGGDAMVLIGEREFDVIVLDLMMPRMTGEEVIRHIESVRPNLLQRVIVTTAAIGRARELDVRSVGAVVTKPFDVHTFVTTIREMARGER